MDQAFALLFNFALHYNGGRASCNQYSVGPLAQLVERRADNAKVVTSSLIWTKFLLNFALHYNGGRASHTLFFPHSRG